MIKLLERILTNGTNTLVTTWLTGQLVGADAYGNRYYRSRRKRDDWRHERRWVVFADKPDPTAVPAGWVGWLHKRIEHPPSEKELAAPRFEREPIPNLTGTAQAYAPQGSLLRGGRRAPATGDYEAWSPDAS